KYLARHGNEPAHPRFWNSPRIQKSRRRYRERTGTWFAKIYVAGADPGQRSRSTFGYLCTWCYDVLPFYRPGAFYWRRTKNNCHETSDGRTAFHARDQPEFTRMAPKNRDQGIGKGSQPTLFFLKRITRRFEERVRNSQNIASVAS